VEDLLRDAPEERPPDPAYAAGAHHHETDSGLVGRADDLRGGPADYDRALHVAHHTLIRGRDAREDALEYRAAFDDERLGCGHARRRRALRRGRHRRQIEHGEEAHPQLPGQGQSPEEPRRGPGILRTVDGDECPPHPRGPALDDEHGA
jgi:hypothetical protein